MSAETPGTVVYLDSSALVKLVIREADSAALRRYLRDRPERVSSALARVEVVRAVTPHGRSALDRARSVLARTRMLRLDDPLLDAAASLEPMSLRSIDAIHLAAARTFGEALEAVVTYDARMERAATSVGLAVAAPM